MHLKKLTTTALLTAIGTVSAHMFYIPVGVSKVFPVQHGINILAALIFGPKYAVAVAFSISLLRNLLGTGSLIAFPGSMIGAFLAGVLFKKTRKPQYALLGEVFGTGIIGAIASYPVAKFLMGRELAIFFFVGPFVLSSLVGAIIGYSIFNVLLKSVVINLYNHNRNGM
ncbi:energy coupling factor transporter S component ThiW [Clostridium formicaceticum]|uniref:Energy coupling factor transporter S component ThiW n=1 Tax=Clostridium formicaceticum TaxID=1497 RepID=A0AAC9RMS0_9CLOT|nr:energy coupling factor transporter S component ThiW [Clostridium formicaceticum]AOY77855.1 energy coupling factor transporter S component ThiW [Clostridium formicaceticum]ARE88472.1 Thiamine-precursor transporter protein (ThiW) [Clostridium formicaceticum]